MPKYKPIDLHKKKSDALVIHCSDPRFQAAYRHQIDQLDKYYDLLVVPGASKAVVNNKSVLEYVPLLHGLHHFETIVIMDHIECGAFGQIDDEVKDHSVMLQQAQARLRTVLPEVTVETQLLGENGPLGLPS